MQCSQKIKSFLKSKNLWLWLLDTVGKGKSGTNWESSTETYYITTYKIRQPVEICYMMQGAQIRRSETIQRDGVWWKGGSRGRAHMYQFSSVAQSYPTLCNPMDYSTPGLPVHHQLNGVYSNSIELVMPSNYLILCHPLLLPPSIFPSIGVFTNESVLHIRWPNYWSFSFSISPSNEHSGLISFMMD